MRKLKRVLTVASATVAMSAMAAGPALAHFCYQANRSAQGNAGAAGSSAFVSIADLLAMEGLCAEGSAWWLARWGLDGTETIHLRTVMAQGWFDREAEGPKAKHEHKMSDGKGIDHLPVSDPELFASFGQAFAMCGGAD